MCVIAYDYLQDGIIKIEYRKKTWQIRKNNKIRFCKDLNEALYYFCKGII